MSKHLDAIAAALKGHEELSGLEIAKLAGIPAGAHHPALARLERDGYVTSRFADGPWPRRRMYRWVCP